MSDISNERPYFLNLDILRFFAATLVLFGHSVTDELKYLQLPQPFSQLASLLTFGKHWVSLFFVLSGFLLSYLAFKDKLANKFNFKKFLIRRILRIWPLYYLFVIIGYFLIPLLSNLIFDKNLSYSTLPYFIFFIGNVAMAKMYEIADMTFIPGNTSILWSISIEEQFYILLAFAFMCLNIKQLKWLLRVISFIGLIYIILPKAPQEAYNYHTLFYIFDFFVGCLVGYISVQKLNYLNYLKHKNNTLEWSIILGFVVILFINNFHLLKIALVLWFALLILYFAFSESKFNQKLKAKKWLIYGGKISYGIYVIHPIFQYLFFKIINYQFEFLSQLSKDILVFLLTFTFTLACAHLSYQYFEKYFLKLKTKFY